MSTFFGCLFSLIFGGLILLLALARSFFSLFGWGNSPFIQQRYRREGTRHSADKTSDADGKRSDGKMFSPDEGEYVDFKEV
ncbi:MAG: hypothetical protein ACI353_05315 [Alloprevotella sp.]